MNDEPKFVWAGLFLLILPLSVVTTFILTAFLRQFYRDRVDAHMRGQSPTGPPDGEPPPGPRVELLEYDSIPDLSPEAEQLYRIATRTPRRVAVVFALAGLAHAVVATVVLFWLTRTPFLPGRTLLTIFVLAWPILPTLVVVALADRRLQLLLPVLFLVVVLIVSGPLRGPMFQLWVAEMLVPTVAMFLVANWWMRSIGPVVLVFTSVFFTGLMLAPFAAYYSAHSVMRIDNASLVIMLAMLFVVLFTVAAYGFIALSAWRYREKRQSSQLMLLNLFWLLVTLWQCFLAAPAPKVGAWAAAGMLAYVAYRLVLAVGLRPFRSAAERRKNMRLLLLRVFGPPAPGERSLEELGLRWRYAGSIQLIAGVDLALANLEPHELLDFLMGRLATHFVKDRGQLETKLANMDVHPDPDGRFRVNEFFCAASMWQEALRELVGKNDGEHDGKNDVVLMDLRGFKEKNRGVIFELTQLINVKPMRKIVMIMNSEKERVLLSNVLSAAWANISNNSPNPRTPAGPLYLLRIEKQNARDTQRLLRLLCAAAASEA
jgi:hypothetical protein